MLTNIYTLHRSSSSLFRSVWAAEATLCSWEYKAGYWKAYYKRSAREVCSYTPYAVTILVPTPQHGRNLMNPADTLMSPGLLTSVQSVVRATLRGINSTCKTRSTSSRNLWTRRVRILQVPRALLLCCRNIIGGVLAHHISGPACAACCAVCCRY